MAKEKPATEVELEELQELYLQDRDNKVVRDKYFILLKNYARSITLKILRKKGKQLPAERVDEVATEAMMLLVRQYRNPEAKVRKSFAGALQWKVIEALWTPAKEEMVASLDKVNESTNKELLENIQSVGAVLPWNSEVEGTEWDSVEDSYIKSINIGKDIINGVIDEAYKVLPYRLWILFMCYFLLKVRRPIRGNPVQNFADKMITEREQRAFDILILEMRNRLKKSDVDYSL